MKINFYLVNKPTRHNEQSIYCYIREYNETLAINTKQSIDPDLWDANTQRGNPRKTRDNIFKGSLKSLNQFLESYKIKIEKIERNIRDKEPNTGFDVIAEAIKERFSTKKTGMFEIYEEFLTVRKKEVAPKTYLKYKHAKELLEEYQKVNREKLNFDKLTSLFFSKFYSFLLDKKNMLNNTANKNIKFIKTFIIWAIENGYSNNSGYKDFELKWE